MTRRIDAHQHFWIYRAEEYPWIDEKRDILKADYMPSDLLPLMTAEGIDGAVAVQARQDPRETDFLLGLAEQHDCIRGVVGWADLRADDVDAQLERFASHERMAGVRHLLRDATDDPILDGLALLRKYGLAFDLLLHPQHLRMAIDVVKRYPSQPFVLDHMAKPFIKDGLLEPWSSDIRELASYENICCKVSGMATEAAWNRWTHEDFRPYLDVVFECFGVDRLMFGSDWPVCTLAGSYGDVVGIVRAYINALSDAEKDKIMGAAAEAFYGLPA